MRPDELGTSNEDEQMVTRATIVNLVLIDSSKGRTRKHLPMRHRKRVPHAIPPAREVSQSEVREFESLRALLSPSFYSTIIAVTIPNIPSGPSA